MENRERIIVAVKSDDIVLRDPFTKKRITTKGQRVVKNAFWLRRIKAGDCIQLKEPVAIVEKKKTILKKKGDK